MHFVVIIASIGMAILLAVVGVAMLANHADNIRSKRK